MGSNGPCPVIELLREFPTVPYKRTTSVRIPKITLNRKKSQQQIVKPDTDQRTENTNSSFHKYQSNTTKNSLLKIVQTYYTVTFDHLTEFKYIQSDNFLSLLNKLKTLTKVVRHKWSNDLQFRHFKLEAVRRISSSLHSSSCKSKISCSSHTSKTIST